MRRITKHFLFAAIMLTASLTMISPAVLSQQDSSGKNKSGNYTITNDGDDEPDQTMFYAFLAEDPQALGGPLIELLKEKPVFRDWVSPRDRMERRYRPLLQWRRWADKKQPFLPALLFIGLFAFLSWSLMPDLLQSSARESRSSFWKCFGTGLILAAVTILITRSAFMTQLGWPLGIVIAGLSQAAVLLGLSVAIYNMGHATLLLLKVHKISSLAQDAKKLRSFDLIAGTFLAALLLQIPAIGSLPQPGTRLLALFSLLGVGAVFRELKKRQERI